MSSLSEQWSKLEPTRLDLEREIEIARVKEVGKRESKRQIRLFPRKKKG